MADGTRLNIGVSGDLIYDEDDGSGNKLPVSKIILGAHGVNAGPVEDNFPLPSKTMLDVAPSFTHDVIVVGTSRVQLTGTSTPCTRGVVLKASNGNAGTVYAGGSGVNAMGGGSPIGYELGAGEAILIPINDADTIWLISDTASQNVFWIII